MNNTKKILILVSNPKGTSNIDVLPEVRNLQEAVQRSHKREFFEYELKIAVKQEDLRRHILDVNPQIIHFCGHGTTEGLILEDDKGQPKPVSNEFLVDLLRIYDTRIECVLFNACDSQPLAEEIANHLNYAIGMSQPVKDKSAIAFSQAFYDGLGAGESIDKAFEFGKNAVLGQTSSDNATSREFIPIDNNPIESGNREHLIPVLFKNPNPQEIKPLWLNPEEEHEAVRELLQEIENRDNKIRLFHAEKPIILKDQYIPIQVTLERRYQHTVETTWSYGESEQELKRIYALKGIGESEIKRQQEDWHKAKQNQSRIVVLADPGMGKSTLLRTELCTVVEESCQALENQQPVENIVIPLLIRLSTLAEKITTMPVEEAIINIIQERHSNILRHHQNTNIVDFLNEFLEQQLLAEKCLLLLDALDEVPQEKRFKLLDKLNNFARAYPNCQIIATSRIVGYGGKLVDDAKEMEIVPFNQEKTEQYIQAWFNNAREYLQDTSVTAEGLIQALRERPQIGGLAQNPLLLSLICSLYQQDKLKLPARRGEIYDKSINCMLGEWRETKPNYSNNKTKAKIRLLEAMAYHFTHEGKEVFESEEIYDWVEKYLEDGDAPRDLREENTQELIDELSEQDGILQKLYRDRYNNQYLFLHRTFQEYFTASYLNQKIEEESDYGISLVKQNLWNYDSHETITLLAGLMQEPMVLIKAIANERDDIFKTQLLLAGRCIAECTEISHPLIDETIERIYQFWLIYPKLDFILSVVVAIGRTHGKLAQKLANAAPDLHQGEVLVKIGNKATFEPLINQILQSVPIHIMTLISVLIRIGDKIPVEHLIKALLDEESDVRRNAAWALGDIGDKAAVEPLIKALLDEESNVRCYAASALGDIGDKAAVEPLIKALLDEASDVRWYAASELGQIGDKAAVEPLIKALLDEESDVRWHAAFALGQIGDKAAVEPLIKALLDEDFTVRWRAAEALGKIGDKAAVEPLINALQDEESDVRSYAAEALGKIGDKAAVEPLIKALQDEESDVTRRAAEALIKIRDKAEVEPLIKALQDEESDVRSYAAEALEEVKPKVESLIKALQYEESDVRSYAAQELLDIVYVEGKAAFEPLIKALLDEDSTVRRYAAWALGSIGDKAAVEPLISALQDDYSDVREHAASALGDIGDKAAVEPLINALLDEDSTVRSSAASALGKIGDKAAVEPLINALLDDDYQVRSSAASALGKIGDKAAVEPLISALQDQKSYVRSNAAEALGEIGDIRAVEPLISALQDQDSEVIRYAAKALGDIRAVEPLINALQGDDYDIREYAAKALGKIGDIRAVEPLISALQEHVYLRKYAAEAFREIDSLSGLKALLRSQQINIIVEEQMFPLARSWAIRHHKEGLDFIPVYPEYFNQSNSSKSSNFYDYIGRKIEDLYDDIRRKIRDLFD